MLTQAVLPHSDAGGPLALEPHPRTGAAPLRGRQGSDAPIHLQRMEADDLLAAVWPGLAACQENAPPGPVAVPEPRPGPPDGR